jgi:hypothetical protein
VRLTFVVPTKFEIQVGGEVQVAAGRGKPTHAKTRAVVPGADDKQVEVVLADATGAFADMAPGSFRLVREYVEPAFTVPSTAVIKNKRGTYVLLALQNKALERPVEVIEADEASTVLRDSSGALREGVMVVVARVGGGDIDGIPDGSILDVQGGNPPTP